VQGVVNIAAVRARVDVPLIGLIKCEYPGYEPYITPTLDEVQAVIAAGADIVAFDATERLRPGEITVATLIQAIHAASCIAMADCSTAADGERACAAGADILATTLCGYTSATHHRVLPALDLVHELARIARLAPAPGTFVVCEGGIHQPSEVRAALDAGADAAVVGTAITNIDWCVRMFAGSALGRPKPH
jgi:N-acylglucosamine-6-phosphate 2-epimerase